MSVQSQLDELREKIPGCSLTAFGDLSSSLILRSSSYGTFQRETLDQLCNEARWSFEILKSVDKMNAPDEDDTQQIVLFSQTESKVFSRSPREENDMVCALVGAGHPLKAALSATAGCAAAIESENK